MFAKHIDSDPQHFFRTDERDGFNVIFVRKGMTGTQERPFSPHWVVACEDRQSLEALARWLAARRDDWQQWGDLAERIGHRDFEIHMQELLERDPPAHVQGVFVSRGVDLRDLEIGETLLGPNGASVEILHVHRFASADDCSGFLEACLLEQDLSGKIVKLGWSIGAAELSTLLDELASDWRGEIIEPVAQRVGARRGRPRRKAA